MHKPQSLEQVVLVDEDDRPVGTTDKSTVHTQDTPLHRAFSLFLFDDHNRLLLQRRAEHKVTWPGIWSNSVCGHPLPDEGYTAAAQRRLSYELGIHIPTEAIHMVIPDYRYRYEFQGVVENEFCPVLVVRQAVTPKPNPDEVSEIRWVQWDDFLNEIEQPNTYSEWCVEEAQLLAKSEKLQHILRNTSGGDSS